MQKTLFTILLFSSGILWVSCNTNSSRSGTSTSDSRQWVRQAYDSIDYSRLVVIFNQRRASEIKAKIDIEQDLGKKLNMTLEYAVELLRLGDTEAAIQNFLAVTNFISENQIPLEPKVRQQIYSYLGIAYLRHGEIENCVDNHNHESCILPIAGKGVHQLTRGSENAIIQFQASLKEFPEDLQTQYLLNLAYMTLGQYPEKVPEPYRINPSWFHSKTNIRKFEDIAPRLGVNRKGHAGGSLIEDINNDGWLDIVITSWGPTDEMVLYINNGDGSFSDQTAQYGLNGHTACLHLTKADYNNDGWIDLLLLRGAWYMQEGDIPKTLLMNTGNGSFTDVTEKSGLTKRAASQASAWADFNLDGWVDLIIANESMQGYSRGVDVYINEKDGTFSHQSAAYGMTLNNYFKGCVATDVNNDRYPDVYLSSQIAGNFLFINQDDGNGNRTFVPAGTTAQVSQPMHSFPCWSFDFNNDGMEDIFVSGFNNTETPVSFWMNSKRGQADKAYLPKLYANKGKQQFEEVGLSMGLNEVAFTMGCNYGDINTDGFLDFYLATGNPSYASLVPNKMYLNIDGQRFEDVSYSGGFANIQKGHGVSFGDLDHDGDEDIYVVIGGAYDGDFFYNMLYENPNEHHNNWIVLDLEGTSANKKAIGARVEIIIEENGLTRKIHRTVTSGASFGGNSYLLEVGLRKAINVLEVKVQWPCKECPDQTYTGLDINKAYKLTEGHQKAELKVYAAVKMGAGSSDSHDHHAH